jgi:hypothetical protein
MTDGQSQAGTVRFSPNAVERHSGTKECNYGGCRETADWDIHLIDRHATRALVRSCDEYVENYWGYHPEENWSVGTDTDRQGNPQ